MARPIRLLFVEDSENDAMLLVQELRRGGYDPDWELVCSAEAVTAALDRQEWDIVIADYSMPHFNGMAALAILQSRGLDLPFIFVSGSIGEDTAVAAMKVGAHDYIMKGNLRRLIPAIDRELREAAVRREHRQYEARIQHLAYYDALTDLPNRTLFHNRLVQSIAIALRERRPLALLILDLDRFKEINDTLGHAMGDLVLQQVGRRLQAALRESDTVARLGGDEFAVLLPSTGREGPVEVTRKILEAVEEPVVLEGVNLDVRASVGIVLCPEHGTEAETLLQRGDVAMYVAKENKNGVCVYATDLDRHSPLRLALTGDLRHAIDRHQLILHYQPMISLRTGKVLGVEALVRWDHPQHGLLRPERFIGLAEHTGLIKQLTLWVLECALHVCRAWHDSGLELMVSVNLSPRALQDRLPDRVGTLLQTTGAAPRWLELEITENIIMGDLVRTLEVLTRLNEIGVRLTIDDFGTGYSSFSYLKRLPVHEIKIDKSFVIGMAGHHDEVIVRSMIELAHNLGLTVVAEGVESQDVLNRLTALGCDAAQGDYIGRPMYEADFVRWLKATEAHEGV
jgi:diguanylate cyclase (GGDEF)-like protein